VKGRGEVDEDEDENESDDGNLTGGYRSLIRAYLSMLGLDI